MPPNVVESLCAALPIEAGSSRRNRRPWLQAAAPLPLVAAGVASLLVLHPAPATNGGRPHPVVSVAFAAASDPRLQSSNSYDLYAPRFDLADLAAPGATDVPNAAGQAERAADAQADSRDTQPPVASQSGGATPPDNDARPNVSGQPSDSTRSIPPPPFAVAAGSQPRDSSTPSAPPGSGNRLPDVDDDGHEIWFTPAPGSPDMVELFQLPDQWAAVRDNLSVFKFYEGQLLEPAPAIVGSNTLAVLRGADAFRKLTVEWHKRIAIEVPAVKPFYCPPSRMREPIGNAVKAVSNVAAAGGRVDLLAMDEPFGSGLTAPECGAPDIAPTATRVERFMRVVRVYMPGVEIGDIEPYPLLSESQIEEVLAALRDRGVPLAFLHLDVDLSALRNDGQYAGYDVGGDIRRLKAACEQQGTRFGFIFWGKDTNSDAVYYTDVLRRVQLVKRTFGSWDHMPEHLVFQSFALSGPGQMTVPMNLPESTPASHTGLIEQALLMLGVHR